MKQIQLNITLPETVTASETDLRMMLASKLYESSLLSLGQAANVAGLSKRSFAELLGMHGVSLFSQTPEDLLGDIANA